MKIGETVLSSSNLLRVLLLLAISAIVLLLRFFILSPQDAIRFVHHLGYYSIAICFLITLWIGYTLCRQRGLVSWTALKPYLTRHRWGLIMVFCLRS